MRSIEPFAGHLLVPQRPTRKGLFDHALIVTVAADRPGPAAAVGDALAKALFPALEITALET
jgi:hypothetical protein